MAAHELEAQAAAKAFGGEPPPWYRGRRSAAPRGQSAPLGLVCGLAATAVTADTHEWPLRLLTFTLLLAGPPAALEWWWRDRRRRREETLLGAGR